MSACLNSAQERTFLIPEHTNETRAHQSACLQRTCLDRIWLETSCLESTRRESTRLAAQRAPRKRLPRRRVDPGAGRRQMERVRDHAARRRAAALQRIEADGRRHLAADADADIART